MSEIVLVTGFNAAGKTTLVKDYLDQGYFRINRDTLGGNLDGLCKHAEKAFKTGETKLVLDNTYATRALRKSIIEFAKANQSTIKCVWLSTSFEDAQFNACTRMVRKHGRLLSPEDLGKTNNPNDFPPVALFSYRKAFEKPTVDEGFDSVEEVKFQRIQNPEYCNKALIVDYDDTVRYTKGTKHPFPIKPHEVNILPGRKEKLKEWKDSGAFLLGISNQSGVAKGLLTKDDAIACFDRTNELLGFEIDYLFCPHNIPPVSCYCRKPHVGNLVVHIEKYKLDVSKCLFVGDQTSDKTCAERCGMPFKFAEEFFNASTK